MPLPRRGAGRSLARTVRSAPAPRGGVVRRSIYRQRDGLWGGRGDDGDVVWRNLPAPLEMLGEGGRRQVHEMRRARGAGHSLVLQVHRERPFGEPGAAVMHERFSHFGPGRCHVLLAPPSSDRHPLGRPRAMGV